MIDGAIETTKEILSNPKVVTVVLTSTFFDRFWMEWGNPVFDALAVIGGVVLVFSMSYLKIQEIVKNHREQKEYESRKK